MEKRSIGTAILLSIITCGIYGIYWMYKMTEDITNYNGENANPGTEILLMIVTCGIYVYFWNYKMGKRIYTAQLNTEGAVASDESVLYLILTLLGLSIVSVAIMQSNINKLSGSW
ncbi:MAG TPA: DUF4234 domain-containing protein [Clostridium sp.]|jgi:hypothetical protein|nr:DUF4234 domain-containing protein [Clostridium sp.]